MADKAAADRHTNIQSMDIYDVQSSKRKWQRVSRHSAIDRTRPKVPTRATIQQELMRAENASTHRERGAPDWIAFGLKIEEQQ